jgi:hypothetical protein
MPGAHRHVGRKARLGRHKDELALHIIHYDLYVNMSLDQRQGTLKKTYSAVVYITDMTQTPT